MNQSESVIQPDAYKEVVSDYYSTTFGLADAARARSQAAWAIASAIASALVAAGLATNLAGADFWVQALGIAAVLAWLATGAIFMWVLMTPLPKRLHNASGTDPAEVELKFATNALRFFREDVGNVQARQKVALIATVAASALTVVAFAVALWDSPTHRHAAAVSLNKDGQVLLRALCGKMSAATVHATLDTTTLDASNVTLRFARADCPAPITAKANSQVAVVIPRADILGVAT